MICGSGWQRLVPRLVPRKPPWRPDSAFRSRLSKKLRRRQRPSGPVAARPHRSGPAPLLDAAARAELVACLRQQPDATLNELRVWVAALGGPAVSPATVGRTVQAVDWRRKKRVSTPPSVTLSG